jgi:hypothetical protein
MYANPLLGGDFAAPNFELVLFLQDWDILRFFGSLRVHLVSPVVFI